MKLLSPIVKNANDMIRLYKICDTCKNSEVVRADDYSIHMLCKMQERYVNSFETCLGYMFDEDLLNK